MAIQLPLQFSCGGVADCHLIHAGCGVDRLLDVEANLPPLSVVVGPTRRAATVEERVQADASCGADTESTGEPRHHLRHQAETGTA
jgi:hypothetical protein